MRKLSLLTLAFLLLATPVFATFGGATQWDVRTTGVDTDGGGFDSGVGSPGTDESQGSGTAISVTLTGTTTGTGSPAFTSTTHGPGNFVHIASGSGCTTGWFEVVSQTAGVATFDHTMGTATNVCVGTIGGSLLTIAQAYALVLDRNTVNVQGGTYTITSSLTLTFDVATIGYNSTHGDLIGASWGTITAQAPLVTTATNSIQLFLVSGSRASGSTEFRDLLMSTTAGTQLAGVESRSGAVVLYMDSVKMTGFTKTINCDGNSGASTCFLVGLHNVEATGFTTNFIDLNSGVGQFNNIFVHDATLTANPPGCSNNAAICLPGGPYLTITSSVFYNIAGTNSDCIAGAAGSYVQIRGTVFDTCTHSGITMSTSAFFDVENSVFYNNTLYGISSSGGVPYAGLIFNNAYGANGTAAVQSPLTTGPGAVTLTAQPFTAPASQNFALNSTAGGGALLKAAAFAGVASFGTGYLDIGALQSQASSGSSTCPYGYVQ